MELRHFKLVVARAALKPHLQFKVRPPKKQRRMMPTGGLHDALLLREDGVGKVVATVKYERHSRAGQLIAALAVK